MRIVRSPAAMQRLALRWRRSGQKVGLVPTMGYLHAGHVRLLQRARRAVGPRGMVVASSYVNPTQFGANEDLSRYPRDFQRDCLLCRQASVDVLFCPTDADIYPGKAEGLYSTYVVEERLSQGMEGSSRPTHFRGVVTIVAKLFNLVLPTVAVFGAKDYQQAAVVRRMVSDLNFPIKILVEETVREPDGLALSSRNQYLSPGQRQQAVVLSQAIQAARRAVAAAKQPLAASSLRQKLRAAIERQPEARVDYVEFFDPDSLLPVKRVGRGSHLAMAVFFGRTRLIDNARL